MGLIVQKYGGTSVGDPARICAVAARIAAATARGDQLVVVVSAMGHTTDELLALAHRVSERPPSREVDMLLTAGERISMALLSMALSDLGVRAYSFTGSQSGILTTPHHRRARIERILGDRIRAALAANAVAIVAGFQGMSVEKEITTLGRGGSDTTAVALAAALAADRCEIFTDVDGVYTADPRVVAGARRLARVGLDAMAELAGCGAGVLHPRSVELAQRFRVPLLVLKSAAPGGEASETRGTEITEGGTMRKQLLGEGMEAAEVVGVTHDDDRALVALELMRPTAASAIWDLATREGLGLLAPAFSGESLRFFAARDALGDWQKACHALATGEFLRAAEFHEDVVPVSVVGSRLTQDGQVLGRIFESLAEAGISVTMGQATGLVITLAVARARAREAVAVLHAALIEREPKSHE